MFTIEDIKAAHSKVNSGADFPAYIRDLIALGVKSYTTFVADGHADYLGKDNYRIISDSKYPLQTVAKESEPELFISYLKAHQKGGSDYPTFCKQAAETGVDNWVVDTAAMTCTYYDTAANNMLTEEIPK